MVHVHNVSEANQLLGTGTSNNCLECGIIFTGEEYLLEHLYRHHIKQPRVHLVRCSTASPPLKLTIKGSKNEGFRIIAPKSPATLGSPGINNTSSANESLPNGDLIKNETVYTNKTHEINIMQSINVGPEVETIQTEGALNNCENTDKQMDQFEMSGLNENVPGGEPTPPPDMPEIPKIRIKTGLLQSSLPQEPMEEIRTPGALMNGESLSSLFKNNDRAKDLGFTTSDPDFMPHDLAMQPFSSAANSLINNNPLVSMGGLPMEQLAQQVSRLQNNNNGVHQQNVLINIQHFQPPPQQPPVPHNYPQMYQQPPPQQGQPNSPIYRHGGPPQYQYPSGGHMYYQQGPPPPGYPPHQMPPPPGSMPHGQMPGPPVSQMGPQMMRPSQRPPVPSNSQMRYPTQGGPQHGSGYPMGSRQLQPGQNPVNNGPRGRPYMPQQQQQRPTGPQMQPRVRQAPPRPRMPILQQTLSNAPKPSPKVIKRVQIPGPQNNQNVKRIKMDTLVPDKNDDADCEVVAVTQKSTNLPQIQSIQGNVSEPNTMHLSESITLTTINPASSPKEARAEAKEVANVLAARGITVTTALRSKDTSPTLPNQSNTSNNNPVMINLNNAVCIIPQKKKDDRASSPTVDLTNDLDQGKPSNQPSANSMKPPPPPPPIGSQNPNHPYECHMCPAKFPSTALLIKHRKTYHRTNMGPEFGIPLIDLTMPGVTQRLTSFGIFHYIPLPNTTSNGMFALPILSADAPKIANSQELASSILTLGPIKPIHPPRPIIKRGKPPGCGGQSSPTTGN